MSYNRGTRQDVKSRTMKFVALDPDIASKYDELDEEDNRLLRFRGGRDQRGGAGGGKQRVIGIIERHITRKDQNAIRTTGAGTGSSKRELVNLITVRNAARSGREHVLKLLSNTVDQFMPIAPKIQDGDIVFYLTNEDDAQAVCLMSKRIADKHNPSMKYVIYSKRVTAPYDTITYSNRQIIEQLVKSRYKQATNSLDLSSFQSDPLLEKHRLSYGLFHNHVMVAVANCVAKNFSTIRGIRLNNNSLRVLDYVSCLIYAAPDVIELDLANNAISRIEELAKLGNWQLESVHFENNEFTMNYSGNLNAYANAIHEHFPRVTYLDGHQIHAAPEASSASSVAIPKFMPGYHTDESLRKMAENFLSEYISFYDGPNGEQTRQQLMNAYDVNATFTYSLCFLPDSHFSGQRDKGEHQELISQYIRSSHNIVNQHKWQGYRDRIIYRGPMDIAVALSKLPPTEHVKTSFLLDFNLVSNNLMVIVLQGIFRDWKEVPESAATVGNLKFFARQFAIIPKSEGLAIISDTLQITPVSTARMERYNNLMKNAVAQPQQGTFPGAANPFQMASPQQRIDGMAPPPPSPQQMLPSTSTQIKQEQQLAAPTLRQTMVEQFSAFSGMRPEWSEKCLLDCNWNWEDSKAMFAQAKSSLPREAFP